MIKQRRRDSEPGSPAPETRAFRHAGAHPRLSLPSQKRQGVADQTIHILEVTPNEIVALKPSGLASELPRDPAGDSFVRRLEAQGFSGLRLVHRLDAASCGLMLVARSAEVAAYYSQEIAARRWRKWYVAQVALPSQRAAPLVGAHKSYLKVEGASARVVRAGGKPSFLDVALVTPVPDIPNESHLLVQLHTGRFHQIRVMLAHRGAPLSGDIRYGGPSGRPMYLEHAILAVRMFRSLESRVWVAPRHPDRPQWAAGLSDAVAAQVRSLSTNAEEFMTNTETLISEIYAAFNQRNIDGALALMSENVSWPKASEGGRVIGKEEIRAYWSRQWKEFDPHVEPIEVIERGAGKTDVRVHQLVKSLDGEVLSDSEVWHFYALTDGLIERMDLGSDEAGSAFSKKAVSR